MKAHLCTIITLSLTFFIASINTKNALHSNSSLIGNFDNNTFLETQITHNNTTAAAESEETPCKQCFGNETNESNCCCHTSSICKECADFEKCIECHDGYFLHENKCEICKNSCQTCSETSENCTSCKVGFIQYGHTCELIDSCGTGCFKCNGSICLSCSSGYQLMHSFQKCILCTVENCVKCSAENICEICEIGTGINASYLCETCSENCIECSSLQRCTKFLEEFELQTNEENNTVYCKEICGDSKLLFFQCDNEVGNLFDGCDDLCIIENGFNCTHPTLDETGTSIGSICSYEKAIAINMISYKKEKYNNSFTMVFEVQPPLYVLMTSKPEDLMGIFKFSQNQSLEIISIKVEEEEHQFVLYAEFFEDFVNKKIQFEFKPTIKIDERYYATPDSLIELDLFLPYYSDKILTIAFLMEEFTISLVVLAWIVGLVGFFTKNLAGLEAIFVIQFAFVSIFWLNTNLYLPFEEATPLKYSTGYSYPFFPRESEYLKQNVTSLRNLQSSSINHIEKQEPHTISFGIEPEILANNYNIMLIVQLLPLFMFTIAFITFKCYEYNTRPTESLTTNRTGIVNAIEEQRRIEHEKKVEEERKKKQEIFDNTKRICFQSLLFFGLINLVNFTNSSVIFFKFQGTDISPSNIIVFSAALFIYVLTFYFFCSDPDPFDYFSYSFQKEKFAIMQYYFYSFAIITTIVLIAALSTRPWASLIPFGLVLVYTAIFRPYKEGKENLRSCISMFVILMFLGIRVIIDQIKTIDENSEYVYLYFIICLSLLLFVIVLSLGSIILHIVYFCIIKPKAEAEDETIMLELENFEIRDRMRDLAVSNYIFRRIVNPPVSLLEVSNDMSQIKNSEETYVSSNESQRDGGEWYLEGEVSESNKIRKRSETFANKEPLLKKQSYEEKPGTAMRKRMNSQKLRKSSMLSCTSTIYENDIEEDIDQKVNEQKNLTKVSQNKEAISSIEEEEDDIAVKQNKCESSPKNNKEQTLDIVKEYLKHEQHQNYSNHKANKQTQQLISDKSKKEIVLNITVNETKFENLKNTTDFVGQESLLNLPMSQALYLEAYEQIE